VGVFLMQKISKKSQIIIFTTFLIIFLGITIFSVYQNTIKKDTILPQNSIEQKNFDIKIEKKDKEAKQNETIVLIAGNVKVNLIIYPNQNFYEVLKNKENTEKILFSGKEYSGIGFFITDIADLHSGIGKNLIYYVNNKEASVGISSYVPQNGDVVEWKLE
jgi:ATP:corrinoid adenosyltransferase